MKTTIEYDQDASTMSCLSIRSFCIKRLQKTTVVTKIAIAVIFCAVIAILGWQIHVKVIEPNDNQSHTAFPIESLKYIQQFVDSSISNDTLHKCFPIRRKKFLQFEKAIRKFMDQKKAIQQVFGNAKCAESDDLNWWWYDNFIMTSRPKIHKADRGIDAAYLPQLDIDRFDRSGTCLTNNGDIVHLNVSHINCDCTCTVDLTSLPKSLEIFELTSSELNGTVDLTEFPQTLKALTLEYNEFTGTVDLTSLPKSLKALKLVNNKFTGTIDLRSLPDELEILFLHENQFTGTVDLTLLPETLELLHLGENQFTGSINLRSLPQSLTGLALNDNKFTGTVDLTSLPPLLEILVLSNNHFTGSSGPSNLPHKLNLELKNFNKSVDTDVDQSSESSDIASFDA